MSSFPLYSSFIYKYTCSKVSENLSQEHPRKEINFQKSLYSFPDIDFTHALLIFAIINKLFLISCCGAGTAADTEMTTQMISSQLELHRLNTGRTPRVCTANRLLKQMLFRYGQVLKKPNLFTTIQLSDEM